MEISIMQINRRRKFAYLGIAALFVAGFFVWRALFPGGAGVLRVSFLSVGEGRAVFVQAPSGATVLIDGGPDASVLRALAAELGPLRRTLTMVIETNPQASNAGGLPEVFARYRVGGLLRAGVPNSTPASRMVAAAAGNTPGLVQSELVRGTRIELGDGAYIEALAPDRDVSGADAATGSLVLKLVYGETSFLLPSDAPAGVQRWLTELDATTTLKSDVLAVGHFGAKDSVESGWLAMARPQAAVISVGENPYGYPATSTRAALRAARAQVLTTATSTVTFISDGRTVWQQ